LSLVEERNLQKKVENLVAWKEEEYFSFQKGFEQAVVYGMCNRWSYKGWR